MRARRRGAVVYGPYPPLPGPASAATLHDVCRLLAADTDVWVVSPEPSAAHEHADLRRPTGVARFSRRAVGVDRLVVRLGPDLLASTDRHHELPARVALAAALRAAGHSTLHLPAGHGPVKAEWARLVLVAADEVVEEREEEADTAVRAQGEPLPEPAPKDGRPPWDVGPEPTREELEAEIRRRAALRRGAASLSAAAGVSTDSGATALPVPASVVRPLRSLSPLGPAAARSVRPVATLVKRVVRLLVAWQIDPVIDHVNLLHRAVIEETEGGRGEGPVDGRVEGTATRPAPGSSEHDR